MLQMGRLSNDTIYDPQKKKQYTYEKTIIFLRSTDNDNRDVDAASRCSNHAKNRSPAGC